MKKLIPLSLALLALGSVGCVFKPMLTIRPALPEIKKTNSPQTIYFHDFEDKRSGDTLGNQVGSIPEWKTTVFLQAPDEPVSLVRDYVKKVFEKAGYKPGEGSKKNSDSLELKGNILEFEASCDAQFAEISKVFSRIGFTLTLERHGKQLITRKFFAEKLRHTQQGPAIAGPYQTVTTEAFEQALDQVADFVESKEFQNALR